MSKQDDNDEQDTRPARPIDDVFWTALQACEQECVICAVRFKGDDVQAGRELYEAALDAVLDGSRPWREGTELVNHIKGCIKSICWNERVNLSALVLRKTNAEDDDDPDPEAEGRSPEEHASDNERTSVLRALMQEMFAGAKEGTLQHSFWLEVAKGNENLDVIAKNLGVKKTQIKDVRKKIRARAKEILAKRGFALDATDDDEDGEES
jgi:hypothetical protein